MRFPTDLGLLNEAREKLDIIIDMLHQAIGKINKRPRSYRKKARKDYLTVSKQKSPRKSNLRQAVKKQLQYCKRNLDIVDKMLLQQRTKILSRRQENLIEKLSWDAYNEAGTFIETVEQYKIRNGYYPEAVLADRIYRNHDNLAYCKKLGIRLSGPRLGRPLTKALQKKTEKIIEMHDAKERNAVEGKFG